MENLETALLLMVVGMATVFAILLIVIYLGKLLISLVNNMLLKNSFLQSKVPNHRFLFPEILLQPLRRPLMW